MGTTLGCCLVVTYLLTVYHWYQGLDSESQLFLKQFVLTFVFGHLGDYGVVYFLVLPLYYLIKGLTRAGFVSEERSAQIMVFLFLLTFFYFCYLDIYYYNLLWKDLLPWWYPLVLVVVYCAIVFLLLKRRRNEKKKKITTREKKKKKPPGKKKKRPQKKKKKKKK